MLPKYVNHAKLIKDPVRPNVWIDTEHDEPFQMPEGWKPDAVIEKVKTVAEEAVENTISVLMDGDDTEKPSEVPVTASILPTHIVDGKLAIKQTTAMGDRFFSYENGKRGRLISTKDKRVVELTEEEALAAVKGE